MIVQKVIVALSGGVDSSVAAWQLLEAGYAVEGLFMKNWEESDTDMVCTARQDLEDAQKVCDQFQIPLHCANFSGEYWEKVFEKFLLFLKKGLTPNPDVWCNSLIKFDDCLALACDHLKADRFATGHYAKILQKGDAFQLFRAKDRSKDQSYFLHTLNQTQLSKSIFPLGNQLKSDVRRIAKRLGLVTAQKPDSMGICFIGPQRFRTFIAQYFSHQLGEICNTAGEVLGEHQGLHFYTIGQRRGLGIGGIRHAQSQPWYVIEKRLADNRLIVTQDPHHPTLYIRQFRVTALHWIRPVPDVPEKNRIFCEVNTRYLQKSVPACVILEPANISCAQVITEQPQRAVTPGQFAVFYQGEEVLGGGIIAPMTA